MRDVANMRSAASSCDNRDNLAKRRLLLRKTIALSAAEIPRFGVLASRPRNRALFCLSPAQVQVSNGPKTPLRFRDATVTLTGPDTLELSAGWKILFRKGKP